MHLEIEGLEDIDPKTGESTGIKLPYIVTLDEGSGKILSITKNWDEQDQLKNAKIILSTLNFYQDSGSMDLA